MLASDVSLDLMEFVEKNILPRYAAFDKAHNLVHATRVIRRSLDLARKVGANADMAYVIAAYHDLGLEGPRAIHHITSGRILISDQRLRKWFTPEQLGVMKCAVEDHRASASHAPRSIYGKIVAEADRDIEPDVVFRRTVEYGLDHYPEMNMEEHWKRFISHMQSKYSQHGYIRLWLPDSPNAENLKKIHEMVNDQERLRKIFDTIYQQETAASE